MPNRITDAHLEVMIENANRILRRDPDGSGALVLYKAYGQVAVRQISGTGARTISSLMSRRELANFLDGMLAAYATVDTILEGA